MKVITTRWLDTNKGDSEKPNLRSRLVGRELALTKRDDIFAATPPLESLRFILSLCASNQHHGRGGDYIVMSNDVKRAYFYAPASRPIYIVIPAEDWEDGDEDKVGILNLSLYGTRDAAMNWADTYGKHLKQLGFIAGRASPCNFYHPTRGIAMTVHGDDFTSTGTEADLRWLDGQLKSLYDIKSDYLGPNPQNGHLQELRILNRIISWTDRGITYEADPRHAELLVRDLELEGAKGATTRGPKTM